MPGQFVGTVRRTVFTQVLWRCGQVIHLLTKHPGAKRGVGQHANAEDHVGSIPVRVDKIIGQRQLYAESGVTFRQTGKPRCNVLLAEKYRSVNTDYARRLHRAGVQLPSRLFQVFRHQTGIANKKMATFRGDNSPRIAIEKLLPQRIFKLMDHAGYLRGRDPLPARDDGEVLRFIHVNKDQQRADIDVTGVDH